MSVYANNEYIIASNNSMNENKHNAEKLKRNGLKALLKPLMRIIKKSTRRSPAKTCCGSTYEEEEQNRSNESLEKKLIAEMENCAPGTAIVVYEEDECSVRAVRSDRFYVPVHFARTEAGTFFWTSVSRADGDFATVHSYTERQPAEQQHPRYDRWVQA
ncbi:Enhancer of split m4 protein [Eumeta japonica]|uniref:Enhancer of split m4 protein n=1 Tax=Eumeta variegata TaxID=151549 RepID=A0A4C1UWZ6_EUMVA|nr:Enhancer of split m4 protein [Eumeta japonica]